MRNILKHIIHCSDSSFGDVRSIREWHKARGWKDVGYHFVIRQDGEIEIGRSLSDIGAHCKGHNKNSIGTCLIGKDYFNKRQFAALEKLHNDLSALFPSMKAYPHNAFNKHKTCPNFKIEDFLS